MNSSVFSGPVAVTVEGRFHLQGAGRRAGDTQTDRLTGRNIQFHLLGVKTINVGFFGAKVFPSSIFLDIHDDLTTRTDGIFLNATVADSEAGTLVGIHKLVAVDAWNRAIVERECHFRRSGKFVLRLGSHIEVWRVQVDIIRKIYFHPHLGSPGRVLVILAITFYKQPIEAFLNIILAECDACADFVTIVGHARPSAPQLRMGNEPIGGVGVLKFVAIRLGTGDVAFCNFNHRPGGVHQKEFDFRALVLHIFLMLRTHAKRDVEAWVGGGAPTRIGDFHRAETVNCRAKTLSCPPFIGVVSIVLEGLVKIRTPLHSAAYSPTGVGHGLQCDTHQECQCP